MELSTIVFDTSAKSIWLQAMGKAVDEEGFIVEKDNPQQRVLTKDGEEILFTEWGGVMKGSKRFIKSDSFSLIELAKKL